MMGMGVVGVLVVVEEEMAAPGGLEMLADLLLQRETLVEILLVHPEIRLVAVAVALVRLAVSLLVVLVEGAV
jgi:hypothetical protein